MDLLTQIHSEPQNWFWKMTEWSNFNIIQTSRPPWKSLFGLLKLIFHPSFFFFFPFSFFFFFFFFFDVLKCSGDHATSIFSFKKSGVFPKIYSKHPCNTKVYIHNIRVKKHDLFEKLLSKDSLYFIVFCQCIYEVTGKIGKISKLIAANMLPIFYA